MEARSRIKPLSNLQSHQAADNPDSRAYWLLLYQAFGILWFCTQQRNTSDRLRPFGIFFVWFSTAAICCLRSFHSCSECSKLCWRASRLSAWLAFPCDEKATALLRRMLTCICEKHALRLYRTWVNKGIYVHDHVEFLFNAVNALCLKTSMNCLQLSGCEVFRLTRSLVVDVSLACFSL